MTNRKPTGYVLYAGASMLDGAPIALIVTGFGKKSANTKTGAGLLQTWILRTDIDPVSAIHEGADESICGNCPHRGKVVEINGRKRNKTRRCYVNVGQAPASVYKCYKRGGYPVATEAVLSELLRGRDVRSGSYGDPAAIPLHVWQGLFSYARPVTGYTHQWRDVRFQGFKAFCMASADSADDALQAQALGWRTFRVRARGEASLPREISCPASKEAGAKTTCDLCKACGGLGSKARVHIVINDHGMEARLAEIRERVRAQRALAA